MNLRNNVNNVLDLSDLIERVKDKYKNIYIFQFEEQVFVYHSVGRKDYKNLLANGELDEQEKEEMLCKLCTIWPVNYDFANCEEAGLPTRLAEEIVKNSYLREDDRKKVLTYYRNEMFDADNQINGIIIAAFPTLNLEEIENWDVATAAKYLSRAEWILHNINGVPFRDDTGSSGNYSEEGPITEEITEEDFSGAITSSSQKNSVAHNGKPKQRLTPEKLAELKAKYPMIDWEHDDVAMHGIEGITNQPEVDSTPPALRPRNKR